MCVRCGPQYRPLNAAYGAPREVRPAPVAASELLRAMIGVYRAFAVPVGPGRVRVPHTARIGIAQSPEFASVCRGTAELRGIRLAPLSEMERICTLINVYNLMFLHAYALLQPPTGMLSYWAYTRAVCYEVCGAQRARVMSRTVAGGRPTFAHAR